MRFRVQIQLPNGQFITYAYYINYTLDEVADICCALLRGRSYTINNT